MKRIGLAGNYKGRVYGIWTWTDIRGIWYWKDLLDKAGVNPQLLKDLGWISRIRKRLNSVLRPQGIEGVHPTEQVIRLIYGILIFGC